MTDEPTPSQPEASAPTSEVSESQAATATEAPPPEGGAVATAAEPPAPATPEGKLRQTVAVKDVGPCKKHIQVTVDRKDIDTLFAEKYKELMVDAQIPGFRPGKAPRRIVVKRFENDVTNEVKAKVLLASLEQLAEEQDIAPLSSPNIDPAQLVIPKEGPFIYEFEVEVRPEFDLPNYIGLHLKRPVWTITDADVENEEKRILARYGQLVPKPDGQAELGDYLIVDMTSRLGDRVLATMNEITMRIDEKLAFKDGAADKFAEQTLGAKAGETRVVDITLSDAVADDSLKGQKVQATLAIKDVKKLRLPELTHEFLHTFGVHTPEQLREQVRLLLERRLEYQQRQAAREQILVHIAASASWELPQDMLIRQARRALGRRVMEMREAGMSEEEIEARQRLLQRDVIQQTALSLKEHFVLQKIAEVEKIDVTEEDINDEIERLADQTGDSPRRVRAQLEREDLMETLAAQLIERRALDLVLENALWEDVETTKEGSVATIEEQAVPGELKDPTQAPPEEQPAEAKSQESETGS